MIIPSTIPHNKHAEFIANYKAITHNDKIFLFAVDHKIEHMNDDFHDQNLPTEINDPQRIFTIASKGRCHALATHPGLIARYAQQFQNLNFIAKLNGKTNIIPKQAKDPISAHMWSIEDVLTLKNNGVNIKGIGFTLYLGSAHEDIMLQQAAQTIMQAHKHGLVTFLWAYPRGEFVTNENDAHCIAGAAGIAHSLGADFVKVQTPKNAKKQFDYKGLEEIITAAGNTNVICAGGSLTSTDDFITSVNKQINEYKTSGIAAGRNIFQLPLDEAIEVSQKIKSIISDQ